MEHHRFRLFILENIHRGLNRFQPLGPASHNLAYLSVSQQPHHTFHLCQPRLPSDHQHCFHGGSLFEGLQ